MTSDRHIAAQLFAAPKDGKPLMLLPIGLPGSGKSFYMKDCDDSNWATISGDQIRINHLKAMRIKGELLSVGGESYIPDPKNPSHVFCTELRSWAYGKSYELAKTAVEQKKNIIIDLTNLTLQRAYFIRLGLANDYHIRVFLLEPNLMASIANVGFRARRGGMDFCSPDLSEFEKVERRKKVIGGLLGQYECFIDSLHGTNEAMSLTSSDKIGFEVFERGPLQSDFKSYLASLTEEERLHCEELHQFDVYHSMVKVKVIDATQATDSGPEDHSLPEDLQDRSPELGLSTI
ncbi:MAG: hypothetical protein CL677_05455 [Bdellovibrionaceae bacterium]|nr:hypothetical protein [Pseudobdellovibrionaceae bacterium]|tara:strand:+ start:21020 stop:21889 length:870 start_codon:yes stop_codon:yes gene_type:complete